MDEQLENHRVNDEVIRKMTEDWIKWHGGNYQKCFIENKLQYGLKNEELNLENMMMVGNWIEKIEKAENYVEAYYRFAICLKERYGSDFLKEHGIEKATPMSAKIMYEQDMQYHEMFEDFGVDEKFILKICKLGLAHLCLVSGSIYFSQFGLIPTILGISTIILLDMGFYLRELVVPIFVEEIESKNVINLYIKKLIYAYKTGNLDKGLLKLELYNLVNILDKNYEKEDYVKVKIETK